ncbi:MAG TPA: DUF202 domain-containing protein, partial [Minicystis sp.]|nr:DUF202 domain-containing protein [Minicystis sp.]
DRRLAGEAERFRWIEANERTFLAWVRMGITLMTFGFLLARLRARGAPPSSETVLAGALLLAAGVAANLVAAARFWQMHRTLESGGSPRAHPGFTVSIALANGAVGLLIVLILVLR